MTWQAALADALIDAGVEVAAWVPDKRLAPIGDRIAERGIPLRTLPREEDCFGFAAGYRAAGGMPLVLLQCSGLGNAINAIGSLVVPYGLGFPAVLSMRGALGERNPSQMPLGRATVGMLDLLGVQAFPLSSPGDAGAVARGALAVAEGRARARPDRARARIGAGMNPTEITAAVLSAAPDALFVASLGTPTSALRAASDDGPHLYLGGSMGTALAAALGVAEKRPERDVVALLGDGEALMGASSLWSLAGLAPSNLLAVVLVDGHYTITGGQPLGVPDAFGAVAAALGLATATARDEDEIARAVRELPRPALLEVRYDERTWPGPSPFVDPPVVRWRFEAAATPR